MALQVNLNLSADDVRRLEEFSRTLKPSAADNVRQLLSVWQYMDMAKNEKLPIYASFDRLHILNEAALEEVKASAKLTDELRAAREAELLEQKQKQMSTVKKTAGNFYEALQLKPSIFGFGVDLKQVFKMFKKKPKG